jgi:hypothetical protein
MNPITHIAVLSAISLTMALVPASSKSSGPEQPDWSAQIEPVKANCDADDPKFPTEGVIRRNMKLLAMKHDSAADEGRRWLCSLIWQRIAVGVASTVTTRTSASAAGFTGQLAIFSHTVANFVALTSVTAVTRL